MKETFGPNTGSNINYGNGNQSIKTSTLSKNDIKAYMTEKPTVVMDKKLEKFRSPSTNTLKPKIVTQNRYETEDELEAKSNNNKISPFMRTNKNMDKSPNSNIRLNSANRKNSTSKK